ncbi:translation initiation factor IF-2-like [Mauremys reevesii]|uniref:translation initiation factor IF-2-like n=1 Tax=Mauremys reevesii TaxID=260615 RepID=UPI00193EFF9B|nr:translation initiation factor IF-2-like [Mauremys reevesii]
MVAPPSRWGDSSVRSSGAAGPGRAERAPETQQQPHRARSGLLRAARLAPAGCRKSRLARRGLAAASARGRTAGASLAALPLLPAWQISAPLPSAAPSSSPAAAALGGGGNRPGSARVPGFPLPAGLERGARQSSTPATLGLERGGRAGILLPAEFDRANAEIRRGGGASATTGHGQEEGSLPLSSGGGICPGIQVSCLSSPVFYRHHRPLLLAEILLTCFAQIALSSTSVGLHERIKSLLNKCAVTDAAWGERPALMCTMEDCVPMLGDSPSQIKQWRRNSKFASQSCRNSLQTIQSLTYAEINQQDVPAPRPPRQ